MSPLATKSSKPAKSKKVKSPAKSSAKPAPKASKPKDKPVTKAADKAPASKEPRSNDVIFEDFTTVPAPAANRSGGSSYDFSRLAPGGSMLLPVSGETKEERVKSAERKRSNLFAAFYRFTEANPAAKEWKRAIRVVNSRTPEGLDSGIPEKVGFYRIS